MADPKTSNEQEIVGINRCPHCGKDVSIVRSKTELRSSSELACSEWMDALAQRVERRMSEIYKASRMDDEETICQRAIIATLGILRDELRADKESASIAAICREGGQANEK